MADLNISAMLPGEYIAGKIIDLIITRVDKRDPEIQKRYDIIGIEIAERWHKRLQKLLGDD